jgi:hypothetical protein
LKILAYQKLIDGFKKRGYEVDKSRSTKLAKWALLKKEKEGFLSFGFEGRYIYFVDGNVKLSHMNDFLKRYAKTHDDLNFDSKDQGILAYTGDLNTKEFRTLAKNMLVSDQYKSMKLKKVKTAPEVIVKRTRSKRKEVQEETKEKITIERETKRTIVEEEVSVTQIRRKLNQWKNVVPKITGKGRERQMVRHMTGFLAGAYDDVRTEQKLGRNRVDAVVGKIGIEAKYGANQNAINRLYGQVDDYLRYLDHVIVVFYDTNLGMINDFKRKLKSGNYNKNVTVLAV